MTSQQVIDLIRKTVPILGPPEDGSEGRDYRVFFEMGKKRFTVTSTLTGHTEKVIRHGLARYMCGTDPYSRMIYPAIVLLDHPRWWKMPPPSDVRVKGISKSTYTDLYERLQGVATKVRREIHRHESI